MSEVDEVVSEFLVESYENIDQLDRDLLTLEGDPDSAPTLASIFRTVHTIKGTCGFLGYTKLEAVAHQGENLLSKLRDGALRLTPAMADALLSLSDAVRDILGSIEATGAEGDGDYTTLVEALAHLQDPSAAVPDAVEPEPVAPALEAPMAAAEAPVTPAEASVAPLAPAEASVVEAPVAAAEAPVAVEPEPAAPVVRARVEPDGDVVAPIGQVLVETGAATEVDVAIGRARQDAGDLRPLGEILVSEGSVAPDQVAAALARQGEVRASVADSTIRVDVSLLDNVMTLVGELVLARNQIMQLVAGTEDAALTATSQRLNQITTELQEGAMKTRMQPIGGVWAKLPRIVRDLSAGLGRQVRLEMEGEDTELDKTILEAIKDPLTHLVRNAVDHGVEAPEVRTATGKPAEGRLLMRAFHEGGQVNIEISDDGAGIDPERVRAKAVERGLVSPEAAARMAEREVLNLIFTAGFSTASAVTNVSGRGVGMDVVRTNIERIGGSVDVHSVLGKGTTFKLKIPLTLAIIPALIVTSAGNRYAIPQVSLLELVRLEEADVAAGIERIHGAPVYRLRGRLLPLVDLATELGHERPGPGPVNIVVLQADDRQFGLVVESVRDSAEIVVKPLGQHLKGIPTFAGATIMGDGRVGLILDVMGLAQRAHVVTEGRERLLHDAVRSAGDADHDAASLLLFTTGGDGRMAIPLSAVDRLEEFPLSAVEHAGEQQVVQYRGEILPLVHISSALPERWSAVSADVIGSPLTTLQVVVHDHAGRRVGLVVDRILDIVEERVTIEPATRAGVQGTVVLNGRVTEVVDLPAILQSLVLQPIGA